MPELPDLVYIRRELEEKIKGAMIVDVVIKKPLVIRNATGQTTEAILNGARFEQIEHKGPFLCFMFDKDLELIMNMMLVGKFKLAAPGGKIGRGLIFTLKLDDDRQLHYLDEKQMGKAYLVSGRDHSSVTRFESQGINPLDDAFSVERLKALLKGVRKQVRVFIMDQSAISSIGNAYADEILFAAGLHPKTTCNQLADEQVEKLHRSIIEILAWGIEQVAAAAEPIDIKVRSHMKVRNRRGQPCPNCGNTIRAVGVLGHDAFFCPSCQPATGKQFIDWNKT